MNGKLECVSGRSLPETLFKLCRCRTIPLRDCPTPGGEACSQARIRGGILTPLIMKKKYFDPNNFKVNMTCRMAFRATQQDRIAIKARAQACGKSVSEYYGKCIPLHHCCNSQQNALDQMPWNPPIQTYACKARFQESYRQFQAQKLSFPG